MTEPDAAAPVRWGLGDAVLATFLGIVLAAFGLSVVLGAAGVESTDEVGLWLLALLQLPLWLGLAGVPVWVARRKGSGSVVEDFGLRARWTDVPYGLLAGLSSQGLLSLLIPPLYRLLGLDGDKVGASADELADRAAGAFDVVCLFLMVVIGAAIVEELCYRGLWQRSFERRFGAVPAVVLTGVVFGAVHFSAYDFLPLALFGVVLSVLAARHGRLGPAIFAHMGFNLTALVSLLMS